MKIVTPKNLAVDKLESNVYKRYTNSVQVKHKISHRQPRYILYIKPKFNMQKRH